MPSTRADMRHLPQRMRERSGAPRRENEVSLVGTIRSVDRASRSIDWKDVSNGWENEPGEAGSKRTSPSLGP
eukprot:scaffold867_cov317-Pavlova_lutheri.AAC.38